MLQFSYWLFPLVFLAFLAAPAWRALLLPGLLAACVAGAADSAAAAKTAFCLGHALAAVPLLLLVDGAPRAPPWGQRAAAGAAWAAAAVAASAAVPGEAWPYELSAAQLLCVFVGFLPAGVVAAGRAGPEE